jgi:hypothetical protein
VDKEVCFSGGVEEMSAGTSEYTFVLKNIYFLESDRCEVELFSKKEEKIEGVCVRNKHLTDEHVYYECRLEGDINKKTAQNLFDVDAVCHSAINFLCLIEEMSTENTEWPFVLKNIYFLDSGRCRVEMISQQGEIIEGICIHNIRTNGDGSVDIGCYFEGEMNEKVSPESAPPIMRGLFDTRVICKATLDFLRLNDHSQKWSEVA